ncbi:hypothetical protein Pmani_016423 [Petrolisthes manimaculis]|uniref:Uncharacterized protein n=1 Tax=Petrolisthes manimaculis TaxID=1843537 RepID=A0AAE1PRQ2_9EUCA|nr:hypothetical protein Pmani_016423 [Petrolisthes manimaculis]
MSSCQRLDINKFMRNTEGKNVLTGKIGIARTEILVSITIPQPTLPTCVKISLATVTSGAEAIYPRRTRTTAPSHLVPFPPSPPHSSIVINVPCYNQHFSDYPGNTWTP